MGFLPTCPHSYRILTSPASFTSCIIPPVKPAQTAQRHSRKAKQSKAKRLGVDTKNNVTKTTSIVLREMRRLPCWRRWPQVARTPCRCVSSAPSIPGSAQGAAWNVNASERGYKDLATKSILQHGFVLLHGLFAGEELDRLATPAISKTQEVLSMLQEKGVELSVGSRLGFHEVGQPTNSL